MTYVFQLKNFRDINPKIYLHLFMRAPLCTNLFFVHLIKSSCLVQNVDAYSCPFIFMT